MGSGAVKEVERDAVEAVRHQPRAHGAWQYFYRNAKFRSAVGRLDAAIYAFADIERLPEDALQLLIEAIDVVMKVIEVHVSGLGDGVRDSVDREYFRPILTRLKTAREGLAQGLPPDPAKRPTREQLLDRMAAMLQSQPLNLPGHTRC